MLGELLCGLDSTELRVTWWWVMALRMCTALDDDAEMNIWRWSWTIAMVGGGAYTD